VINERAMKLIPQAARLDGDDNAANRTG